MGHSNVGPPYINLNSNYNLIMMIYKSSKTPKSYQSLICLFDKDLLRFEPATEFTISAQLSNSKNVTEANVSQKLIECLISAAFYLSYGNIVYFSFTKIGLLVKDIKLCKVHILLSTKTLLIPQIIR